MPYGLPLVAGGVTTPSSIAAARVEALHCGQKLVRFFGEMLHLKYAGPLAIAGGYLRDVALCRTPKDLDLFLDGGMVAGMDGAEELAATIANRLIGASVGRSMPCYGKWAEDVTCVVAINVPTADDKRKRMSLDNWPKGCIVPSTSIDLVILIRDRMVSEGYAPRMVNDTYNQEMFLKSVLRRVDLRLNAIGATPAFTLASPDWDKDAYYSRLVIQKARHAEDAKRIGRRLERLTSEKFLDWSTFREREDGSLQDFPLGSSTSSDSAEGSTQ